MTGEWVDTRACDDIKSETAAIEEIIEKLSCFEQEKSRRILIYCLDYLKDKVAAPGLSTKVMEEYMEKLGFKKDAPTE